jgi:hypothetical protein
MKNVKSDKDPMSKKETPLEFWISNDRDDHGPYDQEEEYNNHRERIRQLYPGCEEQSGPLEATHVIEYSAYLVLESRCESLELKLERYVGAYDDECKKFQAETLARSDEMVKNQKLESRITKLREALIICPCGEICKSNCASRLALAEDDKANCKDPFHNGSISAKIYDKCPSCDNT